MSETPEVVDTYMKLRTLDDEMKKAGELIFLMWMSSKCRAKHLRNIRLLNAIEKEPQASKFNVVISGSDPDNHRGIQIGHGNTQINTF